MAGRKDLMIAIGCHLEDFLVGFLR